MAALVLGLFEADEATEEWNCKQEAICPGSIKSFEVVLTLLTKVIAFYVKLTPIDLRGPSF